MNTFHLMHHPGSSTVQCTRWTTCHERLARPIITDSGGFQAYSLIRQNAKYGALSDNGILFRPEGIKRKLQLTPEKCVQLQMSYGADVVMCLDDCTHVDDSALEQRRSVQRTIAWAERCKREFERLLDVKASCRQVSDLGSSASFKVVDRQNCAADVPRRCLAIGFDGYGYGGWPLDSQGNLLVDLLAYTRELVPAPLPMHALGVGHPESIAVCTGSGLWDIRLSSADARRTPRPALHILPRGGEPFVHQRGLVSVSVHTGWEVQKRQPAPDRMTAPALPVRVMRAAICTTYSEVTLRPTSV